MRSRSPSDAILYQATPSSAHDAFPSFFDNNDTDNTYTTNNNNNSPSNNFTLDPSLLDKSHTTDAGLNTPTKQTPFQSPQPSSFLHPESARRQSQSADHFTQHSFLQTQAARQQDSLDHTFGSSLSSFPELDTELDNFGSINPQLLTNNSTMGHSMDNTTMSPQETYQEARQHRSSFTGFQDDRGSSLASNSPLPLQMLQQPYQQHSRHPSASSIHSASSYYLNNNINSYPSQQDPYTPTSTYTQSDSNDFNQYNNFQDMQQPMMDNHSDYGASQHPSPYLSGYYTPSTGQSPAMLPTHDHLDLNINDISLTDDAQLFGSNMNQGNQHYNTYNGNMMNNNVNDGSFYPNNMVNMGNMGLGVDMTMDTMQPSVVYGQSEEFPMLVQQESYESKLSPAAALSPPPPMISIDPAPIQRQPTIPVPLPEGRHRRAASSGTGSRNPSRNRPRTASLAIPGVPIGEHPGAQRSVSRSPSPSPTGSGVTKSRRNSATTSSKDIAVRRLSNASNISNISDIAANGVSPVPSPSRGGKKGSNGKGQVNPSKYLCDMCDKSFTRAYNLRSHQRTHTDERPFVCTTCGKSFARQHDRKRHEELHTGKKLFICKGVLNDGTTWGCNKEFARADALGRHFKSEQGRRCAEPLLNEQGVLDQAFGHRSESAEAPAMAQQQQMFVSNLNGTSQMPAALNMRLPQLPLQLLQQFPALADLQWDNVELAQPGDEDYLSNMEQSEAEDMLDGDDEELYHDATNVMGANGAAGNGFDRIAGMF